MLIDPRTLGFPILSQSQSDVLVLKPAGIATDLTRDPGRASLLSRLKAAAAPDVQVRLVHRLDRVTRGIVVATLTREAAAFYGEQIREGLWEKYYIARIPAPTPRTHEHHADLLGRHRAYLREGETRSTIARSGGKVSYMDILQIDAAPGRPGECHALIRLLTGRLHQIRVMMAGLDLPLVGDPVYGGAPGPFYLEHAALFYVDCTTREVRLAHLASDPDREPMAPAFTKRLRSLLGAGPGT